MYKEPPPFCLFLTSECHDLFIFRIAFWISLKQYASRNTFITANLLFSGALLARHLIFRVSGEAAAFSMDQYVGNHNKPNRRIILILAAERASLKSGIHLVTCSAIVFPLALQEHQTEHCLRNLITAGGFV